MSNILRETNYQNLGFSYDYQDIFKTKPVNKTFSVSEIIAKISNMLNKQQLWIKALLSIRNKFAKNHTISTHKITGEPYKKGDSIGSFKIFDIKDNGIVLGKNDKHLDFRLLFFSAPCQNNLSIIKIVTLVKFNNFSGKIYFFLIKPFHRIIVKKIANNFC